MRNATSKKRAIPRRVRRGNIAVLSAFMAIVMLGLVAFSVDVGYVLSSQQEIQRTADATALAACWSYGKKRWEDVYWMDAMDHARVVAADYAAANIVGNQATSLELNSSNSTSGDVVFGYINDFWDPASSQQTGTVPFYNSVKVRVRRDDSYNGKVPYFFAKIFGLSGQTIEAEATAGYLRNIGGFEIPYDDSNLSILPIALDIETWEAMLYDGVGKNDFHWDEETETLSQGADNRLEVNLFPQGIDAPGNRGTIDIGSANNATDDIARQILYGVSPEDLAYHGGKLEFDSNGELNLNGDTGISAGVADELKAIKGEPRIIPIFNHVEGPGNNANYTIVKWVGIRIVEVKLNGAMNKKRVMVQPAAVISKGALPGDLDDESDYVYSPVVLVK